MRPEPPEELVLRLSEIALALPEVVEQVAWTGTRWRIRSRTVAHVCMADRDPPYPVLSFQSVGDERQALVAQGPPFFEPGWSPTILGLRLGRGTDWSEVEELLRESYRFCAPQKLVRLLDP